MSARVAAPERFGDQPATAEDYAEQYHQLDVNGLAHDVAEAIPGRLRQYNPHLGTFPVSIFLARLSGWTWAERYIVRHILEAMGGLEVVGMGGVCRDTTDQIAKQLEMGHNTIRKTLTKAYGQGLLAKRSGTIRNNPAAPPERRRTFVAGKAHGPRVIHPGRVLVAAHEHWVVGPSEGLLVGPSQGLHQRGREIPTECVLISGRVESEHRPSRVVESDPRARAHARPTTRQETDQ